MKSPMKFFSSFVSTGPGVVHMLVSRVPSEYQVGNYARF